MLKPTPSADLSFAGTLLAALLAVVACPSDLSASIIISDNTASDVVAFDALDLEKDWERLQEGGKPKNGQGSDAEPARQGSDYPWVPFERDVKSQEFANFSPNSGTGSSTTSSSSVSGPGSVSFAALDGQSVLVIEAPLAQRYAAERAFFLPDAPGLELLRPPQNF